MLEHDFGQGKLKDIEVLIFHKQGFYIVVAGTTVRSSLVREDLTVRSSLVKSDTKLSSFLFSFIGVGGGCILLYCDYVLQ